MSPNNAKLMELFRRTCRQHGILYQSNDVFRYLWTFESKEKQISLFEA